MHFEKYLHNGIKLLKKKDFLEAIQNLEEYISHNNTNYLAYYYLALSYMFRELYDEAYKYMSQAHKLNEVDINTINGLAFLNLKFNNIDEAINYWLDIMDIDAKNYIAKRNLEKIKSSNNLEKLSASAKPDEFINFRLKKTLSLKFPKISLPRTPMTIRSFPVKKMNLRKISLGVLIVMVLVLVYVLIIRQNKITIRKFNIPSRKELSSFNLPDIEDDYMIDRNVKKSIFKLKPEGIKNMFYQTKVLIQKKRQNEALVNINKILHSNAGIVIKERFKILKTFIQPRNTFNIKDNISYSILMNLPVLYEDAQVVWQGKIEDLEIDEDAQITVFNFFTRENKQTVGMAKVIFNKIYSNLVNGQKATVSGKFIKIDDKSRNPIIEGIGLKVIQNKENQ